MGVGNAASDADVLTPIVCLLIGLENPVVPDQDIGSHHTREGLSGALPRLAPDNG
jgi:hypothetical protein